MGEPWVAVEDGEVLVHLPRGAVLHDVGGDAASVREHESGLIVIGLGAWDRTRAARVQVVWGAGEEKCVTMVMVGGQGDAVALAVETRGVGERGEW